MEIHEMAYILKLPYIRENSQMLIDEANHTKMSYREFLNTFLEREMLLRKENGMKHRLRNAKFPIKKYLEDFDRDKYGKEFKIKFDELETLKFIDNKENIILIGTPGAGNYRKFFLWKNILKQAWDS